MIGLPGIDPQSECIFATLADNGDGTLSNTDSITLLLVPKSPTGGVAYRINEKGRTVGHVLLGEQGGEIAEIRWLEIDAGLRGRKIGERVFKALLATAGRAVRIPGYVLANPELMVSLPFWMKMGVRWVTDAGQTHGLIEWSDYASARL